MAAVLHRDQRMRMQRIDRRRDRVRIDDHARILLRRRGDRDGVVEQLIVGACDTDREVPAIRYFRDHRPLLRPAGGVDESQSRMIEIQDGGGVRVSLAATGAVLRVTSSTTVSA